MAVPKNKASKARTRRRKAINSQLKVGTFIECGNCGNSMVPHRVCPKCGFYKGKQVLDLEDMA